MSLAGQSVSYYLGEGNRFRAITTYRYLFRIQGTCPLKEYYGLFNETLASYRVAPASEVPRISMNTGARVPMFIAPG